MMSVCGKQWGMCGKCGGGCWIKTKTPPHPYQYQTTTPVKHKKKIIVLSASLFFSNI